MEGPSEGWRRSLSRKQCAQKACGFDPHPLRSTRACARRSRQAHSRESNGPSCSEFVEGSERERVEGSRTSERLRKTWKRGRVVLHRLAKSRSPERVRRFKSCRFRSTRALRRSLTASRGGVTRLRAHAKERKLREGIEPPINGLQPSALPFGHRSRNRRTGDRTRAYCFGDSCAAATPSAFVWATIARATFVRATFVRVT